MAPKRFCISPRMKGMVWPVLARSSKGSRGEKIAPAFDALVKVAPSNPAKATACCTPGVARIASVARRITASVRASEAPGGSATTVMR